MVLGCVLHGPALSSVCPGLCILRYIFLLSLLWDDPLQLSHLGTAPTQKRSMVMAWVILFIAGLLEVAWALLLKQSAGFSKPLPTIGFVVSLAASMLLLSYSLRTLPVGTAYAVWTGIGAAGTAIIGILWLGESRDVLKLISLVMLVGGIIGMRLTSSH